MGRSGLSQPIVFSLFLDSSPLQADRVQSAIKVTGNYCFGRDITHCQNLIDLLMDPSAARSERATLRDVRLPEACQILLFLTPGVIVGPTFYSFYGTGRGASLLALQGIVGLLDDTYDHPLDAAPHPATANDTDDTDEDMVRVG